MINAVCIIIISENEKNARRFALTKLKQINLKSLHRSSSLSVSSINKQWNESTPDIWYYLRCIRDCACANPSAQFAERENKNEMLFPTIQSSHHFSLWILNSISRLYMMLNVLQAKECAGMLCVKFCQMCDYTVSCQLHNANRKFMLLTPQCFPFYGECLLLVIRNVTEFIYTSLVTWDSTFCRCIRKALSVFADIIPIYIKLRLRFHFSNGN